MGKFLDLDSPLMRFLSKLADLLWLNVLTVVCCVPIVTAGASFTALHYSCLKMVRGEESYITKDFFKAFKRNFRQATIIWLIIVLLSALLAFDFYYVYQLLGAGDMQGWWPIILLAGLGMVAIFLICTVTFIFPVLSHFNNTIKGTIKNSFLMSVLVLPKTVLMVALMAVPFLVMYFLERIAPLAWLYWFSFPAYIGAMLYNKTFKRFEPETADTNDDFTWTVGGSDEGTEAIEEISEVAEGTSGSEENTDSEKAD